MTHFPDRHLSGKSQKFVLYWLNVGPTYSMLAHDPPCDYGNVLRLPGSYRPRPKHED